jgi:excisionase family DNA binding protein
MTHIELVELCRGFQSLGYDGQAAALLTLALILAGEAIPETRPLTVKQAAERLNVSIDAVYDLCRDGRLKCFRAGEGRGTIRIRPADLHQFQINAA